MPFFSEEVDRSVYETWGQNAEAEPGDDRLSRKSKYLSIVAFGSGKFSLPSESATLNFPCRRRSLKILGIPTCPESVEVERSVQDALTQNAKARRDRWSRQVDNIKTNRTKLENIARPILQLTFPPKKRGRAMAGRGVTVAMTRQRATLGAFPRTRLTRTASVQGGTNANNEATRQREHSRHRR